MTDASYTQVTGELDCNKCVWGTRDGGCASWECEFIDRDDAVKAWRNMPSVELETKQQATVSSDCIYRQQALEAIRNIKAITGTFDDEILLIDKAQVQTELMMLPSAEPEIIRCKDCKYAHLTYSGDCKFCDKWTDEFGIPEEVYLDGAFFCGYAKRREDE